MEKQENEFDRYCYLVKISGQLDQSWAPWLGCATITSEVTEDNQMPSTILTYPVIDQPALRGSLNKLFDLNLTLLSVIRCNPDIESTNRE
jgi:hypothetical protein